MQIITAYEADQRKKMYGYSGGDMTSPGSTELTSVCYEYSYPDNNCNTNKAGNNVYGVSEHHYEQPMVILPSRSPVDSIVKPLISDTSSSSTGGNFRAYYHPLQIRLGLERRDGQFLLLLLYCGVKNLHFKPKYKSKQNFILTTVFKFQNWRFITDGLIGMPTANV